MWRKRWNQPARIDPQTAGHAEPDGADCGPLDEPVHLAREKPAAEIGTSLCSAHRLGPASVYT